MTRVEISGQTIGPIQDPLGNALQATCTVKNLVGTNATHWSAETGGTSSTSSLVSDANGTPKLAGATRYIDVGQYLLDVPAISVTDRRVEVVSGTLLASVESDVGRIPWVNVTKPIGIFAGATGVSGANNKAAIERARDLLPVATPSSPGAPVVNDSGGGILYFPGTVGDGVYDSAEPLDFSGMVGVTFLGDAYGGNFYNGAPASRLRYTGTGATTGTGSTTSASPTVTSVVAGSGSFQKGQPIAGSGIPAGTRVLSVAGTTLTLDRNATATAAGVALTATAPPLLDFRTSYGCAVIGLGFSHSAINYAAGTLLDLGRLDPSGGQGSADFYAAYCYFAGNPPYEASSALGVDADLLLDSTFFKCFFHGLDRAIKGLAAAPPGRWSNTVRVICCNFSVMAKPPILNPGGAWVIRDNTFQQLQNGQAGAIESEPGFYSQALVIDGNYMGDAGLAVTGVAATNLFTAGGHGLVAGDPAGFLNLAGGAGLSNLTTYYVIASGLTATTFKVSATPGGAEVNFTTDITAPSQVQGGTWIDVESRGLELGGNWISAGARSVNLSGGVVEGVKTGGNLFHYVPVGIDLGANVGYMDIGGDSWENVTSKIVATGMAGLAAAGIFHSGHPSYPFWWTQTDAYTNLSSAGDSNLQIVSRATNRPALFVGIQGTASTPFGSIQAADDITNRELRLNPNGGAIKTGAGNHGFYGATPVAKPTGVPVTAADIHAALVSLGLIAA